MVTKDAQGQVQSSGSVLWSDSWWPPEEERTFTEGSPHTVTWCEDVKASLSQGEEKPSS